MGWDVPDRPRVHGIVSVYLEYLFVRLDTEKERITIAWLDAYMEREGWDE